MKVRIAKTFDFDAAHYLPNVAPGHKCARLHGHTYRVEVSLAGIPDERGMVVDYAELAAAWQPIHDALDHRLLNDIPGLMNPTTEILAPWIHDHFWPVSGPKWWANATDLRVRVYESSTTYCEYPVP
jgi:6-pyruvoyltetrahydropterin/6-carboxytetrahydropterin synthase